MQLKSPGWRSLRALVMVTLASLPSWYRGIILPQMYTAAAANIANVVTNYILLYWMDLGVIGYAAANTLSQLYICSVLFAYICWKKLYFSLGIQAAACVRVGNALGARDRAGAILTSKVSLALSGSMAVIQGIMLISTKTGIAFMFTSDELNWKRMTEKAVKRAGKAGHMVSMRSIVAPDHTENNGRGNLRGSNWTPEVQREDGSPRALLSTTQLVLRRGLTVLAAIAILVVGTSVHLLLPLPISSWSNLSIDWSNTTFTTTYPPELVPSTVLI
ncbi:unnamed protein product, partial [Coregonus sp. 'balchen']